MLTENLLSKDLNYILHYTAPLFETLRGERLFISGGTGFFGRWLLESFSWINTKLNLEASATILTRNKENFASCYPHIYHNDCFNFHEGDIRNFHFPAGKFSHVIHGAADGNVQLSREKSLETWEVIVNGTEHILQFAQQCQAKRFLFISSGAVYHLPKNTDDIEANAYTLGKVRAEGSVLTCAQYNNFDAILARCFAFVGPYLPLDGHFAIGNFIANRLKNEPIIIKGDGKAKRSYLYAADLAIWLWTILLKGKRNQVYDVGSADDISMGELAKLIATIDGPCLPVEILNLGFPQSFLHYLPNVKTTLAALNLPPPIPLTEAIKLTIQWHKTRNCRVD